MYNACELSNKVSLPTLRHTLVEIAAAAEDYNRGYPYPGFGNNTRQGFAAILNEQLSSCTEPGSATLCFPTAHAQKNSVTLLPNAGEQDKYQ